MDKLRALQYFVIAAQERSLSGAARRCEVSVPAVSKLIAALEREMGASLFDRTTKGLSLTADGETYFEACRPLLEQLDSADEILKSGTTRPRGVVVLGAAAFIIQSCILPALPRFHARYPDLQIDVRVVNHLADPEASAVDVFVLAGWPESPDLVHRHIAQTRFLVCAAPEYWARHGIPRSPEDLLRHQCLLLRNPVGTVLDLWQAQRGSESLSLTVGGWLVSSHRDVILDAVLAGEGVARLGDLTIRNHLQSGRLAPVLLDWAWKDAPPVNLLYRPTQRRTPRVRLFVDFIAGVFRDLEAERDVGTVAGRFAERPYWYRHERGRASRAVRHDK